MSAPEYSDLLESYASEGYSAADARMMAGSGIKPTAERDEDEDDDEMDDPEYWGGCTCRIGSDCTC